MATGVVDWTAVQAVVEIVVGAGTITYATWRFALMPYAIRPTRSMINELKAMPGLREQNGLLMKQQEVILKRLDEVIGELRPNGGNSMRDVINKLDKKVDTTMRFTRAILGSNPMAVELSPSGGIVSVSRGITRHLHRTESELEGSNWIGCIHVDDRHKATTEIEDAVINARDIQLHVRFMLPESNEYCIAELTASAMKDADGHLLGWVGQFVPIHKNVIH